MAASFHLQSLQGHKSHFLGQAVPITQKSNLASLKFPHRTTPIAKLKLYEILGGRGLCSGEEGLQKELQKSVPLEAAKENAKAEAKEVEEVWGFEKELMGLTGGFPGGEKGLQKFIQENPPPKKGGERERGSDIGLVKKPKAPELPLLLPGMIAIVKNPNNPYYMYCGIVQRITDGKAGVLFEGGNWDRLITFRLEELQRRDKGPPMVSPRSAILEQIIS